MNILHTKSKIPYFTLIIGYLIFALTLISLLTHQQWITQLDQFGHQSLQFLPHSIFDSVAIVITYFGQHEATIALVILFGTYLFIKHYYTLTIFLVQNILLGNLLNHFVKSLVQRSRPALTQILPQSGYSFPSGHSANSIILYGTLLIILFYFIEKKSKRVILTIVLIVLAFLIGCSRVYLQVHYPSDVLAGWTSALGNLSLFYLVSRHFYLPKRPLFVPSNDSSLDRSH